MDQQPAAAEGEAEEHTGANQKKGTGQTGASGAAEGGGKAAGGAAAQARAALTNAIEKTIQPARKVIFE